MPQGNCGLLKATLLGLLWRTMTTLLLVPEPCPRARPAGTSLGLRREDSESADASCCCVTDPCRRGDLTLAARFITATPWVKGRPGPHWVTSSSPGKPALLPMGANPTRQVAEQRAEGRASAAEAERRAGSHPDHLSGIAR